MTRFGSAATSCATRSTPSPNCSPKTPIRSGRGISRSWPDRRNGPTSISTSFSTSSAAGSSAGASPIPTLFQALFDDTLEKHAVPPGQLTLHAGGPMKATALMLAGVTRSHSRPPTSNDNPFSEAHFKTLKYQPQFPRRFGCVEDAKDFCRRFFAWYNQDHHHAGLGLMTPDQVHYGQADDIHATRQRTLDRAFDAKPERFVKKPPVPPTKPTAVWINPPHNNPEPPSLN